MSHIHSLIMAPKASSASKANVASGSSSGPANESLHNAVLQKGPRRTKSTASSAAFTPPFADWVVKPQPRSSITVNIRPQDARSRPMAVTVEGDRRDGGSGGDGGRRGDDEGSAAMDGLHDVRESDFGLDSAEGAKVRRANALHTKKVQQWVTWMHVTIPALLAPHMQVLRETASLRNFPSSTPLQACKCGDVRKKEVVCVFFHSAFI